MRFHFWLELLICSILIAPTEAFTSMSTALQRTSRTSVLYSGPNDSLPTLYGQIALLPFPFSEDPALTLKVGASSILLGVYGAIKPPGQLVNSNTLEEVVTGTFLERRLSDGLGSLRCVYKASRDGWSATKFHECVDNNGSGVVVARTLSGKVFGGFNPSGWRSTDDYTTSTTAFLWCLSRNKVQKYPVQASGAAVYDYATSGPCFGSGDVLIGPPGAAIMGGFAGPQMENDEMNAGSLRTANVLPGQSYTTDKAWPVRANKVVLQEVEVYCLVET